jgi:hypothetical protein
MELAMEFFEAPAFSHHLARYLDDAQYRVLQDALTGCAGTRRHYARHGRIP